MVRLAASYDAGLVAEDGGTQNRQIALTNKQFTYLLAGIPAIMSETPAHKTFASEAGAAVMTYGIDDPTSLASAFDRLFSNPDHLALLRRKAYALGQERYNWEAEAPTLLTRVSQALEGLRSAAE
jgi:glycosyltransferase involved in cell wall biosynthesis